MGLKSFLQSFLGGAPSVEEPEVSPLPLEQPKFAALPQYHPGVPLDVMSETGAPLFSGRLDFLTGGVLSIERIPGDLSFPVLKVGSTVKVRGYDKSMEPVTILATVAFSSLVACRLENLEVIPYANQRKNFRQPLRMAAAVYNIKDTYFIHPEECLVQDISVDGACLVSSYAYEAGMAFRLGLELVKNSGQSFYAGQIVRVLPREDGRFEYGVLFAQLSRRKKEDLAADLRRVQAEMERKLLS